MKVRSQPHEFAGMIYSCFLRKRGLLLKPKADRSLVSSQAWIIFVFLVKLWFFGSLLFFFFLLLSPLLIYSFFICMVGWFFFFLFAPNLADEVPKLSWWLLLAHSFLLLLFVNLLWFRLCSLPIIICPHLTVKIQAQGMRRLFRFPWLSFILSRLHWSCDQ